MNGLANITCENNRLIISGDLDFSNVMSLWDASLPLLAQSEVWLFDLSHVGSSNSAGLALLVEWIKLARKKNKKIHFDHIPSQLFSIAKVCGVDLLFFNDEA